MAETLHASLVVLGEAGILIRGEAGSGKSSLVRRLLADASALKLFSRLVADDRTRLEGRHGRLVGRAVAPIAGLIEIRGIGLVRQEAEPAAIVRLVVDLAEERPERLPAPEDGIVTICGVPVPRIRAQTGAELTDIVLKSLQCGVSGDHISRD